MTWNQNKNNIRTLIRFGAPCKSKQELNRGQTIKCDIKSL